MSLTNQFKPKIIDRKNRNPGTIPEGSVCSVRKRNPRISESAIFETQFLFPVVLEITCHWTETLMNALPCHQQNHLLAIFTMDRVRTDFWIQNSRLFFQNNNFFFQSPSYQIIQTLKSVGTKTFHDAVQMYGRDWIRFDQNEKKITYETLVVAFKNTQDFLPFFQTFSRSGKLLEKNFRLFQEFKILYEHCMFVFWMWYCNKSIHKNSMDRYRL